MKFKWYHLIWILAIIGIIGIAAFFLVNPKLSTSPENGTAVEEEQKSSAASKELVKKEDQSENTSTQQAEQDTAENAEEDDFLPEEAATVSKNAPEKPELSTELTHDYKVKLSWKAVEDAEYYELYRYDAGKGKWLKKQGTTDFSFIDNDVEDKQTYSYRLYALRKMEGEVLRSESAEASVAIDSKKTVKALVVDFETGSSKRMVKYLKKAGFIVDRVESIDAFKVEDYDTLVIPGGHNITPSKYGAERDSHTYGTNEEVDDLQFEAVRIFRDAKKPVLGICRGCQVVNVALGGTINQHIPGWHKKYRTVKIDRKSWLYKRLGTSESVYHYHHQCVEKLAEGLVATQWDEEDGHIEGYEHETLPIYGIQWHPDKMDERGIDFFKYYKSLVIKYYNQGGADKNLDLNQ